MPPPPPLPTNPIPAAPRTLLSVPPSTPPPLPPPRPALPPGATLRYTVTSSLLLSGDVATFDDLVFRSRLSRALGVPESAVVSVASVGGSVAVTSTVASASEAERDGLFTTLQGWDALTASEALELSVERVLAAPVRAVDVVPAPPPRPSPTPPPADEPARACAVTGEEACADGLEGSDCQLCSSNDGCDLLLGGFAGGGGGGACTRGLLPWSVSDSHRGFECGIEGLGTLAFGCEPAGRWTDGEATGSCSARVTIQEIVLECRGEGCSFNAGSYAFGCADIKCDGLEQVEGLLLGGRVEISCLSPEEAGVDCGADQPTECSIYISGLDATVSAQCEQSRCAPPSAAATCDPAVQACSPDHPVYTQALASSALSLLSVSIAALLWARFGTPRAAVHLSHAGALPAGSPPPSPPGDPASAAEAGLGGVERKVSAYLGTREEQVGRGASGRGGAAGGTGEPPAGGRGSSPSAELSAMLDAVRPVPTPRPVLRFEIGVSTARPAAGSTVRKYVLCPISGALAPGETVGVLGPSGSGKSTLLSAIAGDVSDGLRAEGKVTLGGVPAAELPRGIVGYCAQDDVLTPTLTPFEAVMFAATLRLPRDVGEVQRARLVWCVLRALHLHPIAASSLIGSREAGGGGISGGERRRVSLATLLVSAPFVLLVDEPTSGLDARSALVVGALLSDVVSSSGRAALLSMHQPSSRLFATLDQVILLARGTVLHRGPRADVRRQLTAAGLPTPPSDTISISDHLLELAFTHPALLAQAAAAAEAGRPRAPAPPSIAAGPSPSRVAPPEPPAVWLAAAASRGVSRGRVARELAWRCSVQLARNSTMLRMQLAVALGMAVLMGLAFFSVSTDAAGFQNKAGAMQITLVLFSFGGVSVRP